MKITRTITKARYNVLVFNKDSKQMLNDDFIDTENLKPEYLEKHLQRSLSKNMRLVDFEQAERLSFKLTINLEWAADAEMPTATVESLEPVENGAYNE